MTQPQSSHRQGPRPGTAVFVVAAVAVSIVVAYSWHTTSRRIAALEAQLQGLADTVDQRLPAADWQEQLARAATRLEDRIDDRMRSERRRLTTELHSRVEDWAATAVASRSAFEAEGSPVEPLAPAAADAAASDRAADPAADSGDGLTFAEEERFAEMFESMRHSLGVAEDRWAELEFELELVLESFWPEYVALSNSPNPDTAGLHRRYCARLETLLLPEEVASLGCGGPQVIDLVQPPPAGTAP